MSVHYSPTISVRSLSPPELGLARVRHLKWPKSDKSDFGWEREQIEPAAPLNIKHRDSSHGEMRQVLSLAAASAMTGCPPCAGMTPSVRAYGFENVPMMPVAPLACPSNALMSSSRVRPGWSAFGSRSVPINVKV